MDGHGYFLGRRGDEGRAVIGRTPIIQLSSWMLMTRKVCNHDVLYIQRLSLCSAFIGETNHSRPILYNRPKDGCKWLLKIRYCQWCLMRQMAMKLQRASVWV